MIQKKRMGRTPVYLLLLLLLIGMLSGCGAPGAEEPAMEMPVIEVPEIVIEKPRGAENPLTETPVYSQGDIITFGHYPQDGQEDPIEWIVLKQEGDSVLLVSRYGLECSRFWYDFSETDRDSWWERSDLRAMLNNPFYITAFSGDEHREWRRLPPWHQQIPSIPQIRGRIPTTGSAAWMWKCSNTWMGKIELQWPAVMRL